MKILADGSTSRLYRKLVVEDKVAATTGGYYSGYGLDSGAISLYAVAGSGNDLDTVEAAVDGVLDEIRKNGVTAARARARQEGVPRRLHLRERQPGEPRPPLRLGRRHRPLDPPTSKAGRRRIAKVTADDVKKAADNYLDVAPLGDRLAAARARRRQRRRRARRAARRALAVLMPIMRKGYDMVAARSLRSASHRAAFRPTAIAASLAALAVAFLTTFSLPANAMKIQTVKSPGGIEAWLVEEHACR